MLAKYLIIFYCPFHNYVYVNLFIINIFIIISFKNNCFKIQFNKIYNTFNIKFITTNNGVVTTNLYLEYKNFYLIIKNGKERYIKKRFCY